MRDRGYAIVDGNLGAKALLSGLTGVPVIDAVNLMISPTLALFVALRSRGTKVDSISKLLDSVWTQIKISPLLLVYPA